MKQHLAATSKVAGTTTIGTSVLSNLAIRSLTSIIITHVMVAHVAFVVHQSCTLVWHRSIATYLCRSRCGLVHVSIV